MPLIKSNYGIIGGAVAIGSNSGGFLSGRVEQQLLTGASQWPGKAGIATVTDPYFPYVSLLLDGESTNGATNNTFLDSSQNNTTLTDPGFLAQGSFSPFGDNWSNYFDGTGDFFTVPANTAFNLGTGDFTIEFWAYLAPYNAFGGSPSYWAEIVGVNVGASDSNSVINTVGIWQGDGTGTSTVAGEFTVIISGTSTNQQRLHSGVSGYNQWTHVALTRSSGTFTLWQNGISRATATLSADISRNDYIKIGKSINSGIVGYLSNLRIIKGTALYTSTFTPSTTPLTAVSGTSLLTCQSNRFKDNSANNFAITVNGDVAVQRWSPFSPTTSYSASTDGGSIGKFVTNNYLSLPSTNFAFGTASFTVELWLYYIPSESATSYGAFFDNGSQGVFLSFGTARTNLIFYSTVSGQGDVGGFAHGMAANTWNHLAFVRNGTTQTIYVNGASIGSYTSVSGTMSAQSATAVVGTYSLGTASYPCGGYISNMRIVNGVAVYTGNFTPPTLPLTTAGATSAACYPSTTNVNISFAASSTSLLLNGTNSGILDYSRNNVIRTVSSAQISTAQSKFGGSSIYFNSSFLAIPWNEVFYIGNGDYTCECWINLSTFGEIVGAFNTASPYPGWLMSTSFGGSGKLSVFFADSSASQTITSTGSISTNTWTHIAFTKQGTSIRLFINGSLDTTTTLSMSGGTIVGRSNQQINIGADSNSTTSPTRRIVGYIDDLRITKGIARYTSTFTPPTSASPLR